MKRREMRKQGERIQRFSQADAKRYHKEAGQRRIAKLKLEIQDGGWRQAGDTVKITTTEKKSWREGGERERGSDKKMTQADRMAHHAQAAADCILRHSMPRPAPTP